MIAPLVCCRATLVRNCAHVQLERRAPRAMMSPMAGNDLLQVRPKGIYCPLGDFYIDPWRPVERAVITHGHADHARPGHKHYLATPEAAPVMRHRLGEITLDTLPFGQTRDIGGVEVSLHLSLIHI